MRWILLKMLLSGHEKFICRQHEAAEASSFESQEAALEEFSRQHCPSKPPVGQEAVKAGLLQAALWLRVWLRCHCAALGDQVNSNKGFSPGASEWLP